MEARLDCRDVVPIFASWCSGGSWGKLGEMSAQGRKHIERSCQHLTYLRKGQSSWQIPFAPAWRGHRGTLPFLLGSRSQPQRRWRSSSVKASAQTKCWRTKWEKITLQGGVASLRSLMCTRSDGTAQWRWVWKHDSSFSPPPAPTCPERFSARRLEIT